MNITPEERQKIKQWVMASTYPEVVIAMQKGGWDLPFTTPRASYPGLERTCSLREQIPAYKARMTYAAEIDTDRQGIFRHIARGGLTDADATQVTAQDYERFYKQLGTKKEPVLDAPLFRALVEAQTGFFTITQEELFCFQYDVILPSTTLRDMDIGPKLGQFPDFQDRYKTIYETCPHEALRKVTLEEFKVLVAETFKENGLLVEQPQTDVTARAATASRLVQLGGSEHDLKVPPRRR